MDNEDNKRFCYACRFFNDDEMVCDLSNGKLRGIVLNDSLALADNGCEGFEEATYILTPKGILQSALIGIGFNLDDDELTAVWNDFEEGMKRAGYVKEEEE